MTFFLIAIFLEILVTYFYTYFLKPYIAMNWESLIAMDWGPCHYKEIKTFGDYVEWLYFTYCLQTGIYILDGWERIIFSKYSY